ncbi:20097_t:CDS:2 [Racocetra persica]|uniref:20097_t:CDS:1 n=1 Tax=Racocetra persica TaxID=160502 RepID=A0ACA9N9A5_9GLOM|nr:20097_t:CDS:2 [Racocetra persica]
MKLDFPQDIARDYEKLLQHGRNSDVIIRAGEGQNFKEFRAHSLILNARSTYFCAALSAKWAKKEGDCFISMMPNIPPCLFEIIIRYIYTTEIILNNLSDLETLQLLVAADELLLQDFIDRLLPFIHQKLEEFMRNDAISILQFVFKYNACKPLRDTCFHIICSYPEILFEHQKFTELEKSLLILIMQRDDLGNLTEMEIWNYLIKWGTAQDPALQNKVLETWEENEFSVLKNIIVDFIPLIRWNNISSAEFWKKRSFFQNVLSKELYQDILAYYLDSTTPPAKTVMLKSRTKPVNQDTKKFDEASYADLAKINEMLLQDDPNYDVIIRAGDNQNLKEFHAHSLILNARSPDFFGASNYVEKDGKFSIFTFENISVNTFETILRYLYTAKITLDDLEILKLFVAVNELNLKDFIDKVILFMHQDLESFMKHDSVDVLKIAFQYDSCESLRNMCLQFICASPESLFEHQKFVQLDQSILTLILKRDDLGKLNEIDIWNYLVKWGIAKNQSILQNEDMKTWKDDDYNILKKIIDDCIPLIRWFQISGKEFRKNISFLENILSTELYHNILNYHLDPSSLPKEITILPPRYKLDHMPHIRSDQFNIIASWIDKKDLEKDSQNFLSGLFQSNNTSERTISNAKLKDTLYYNSNNNPYDFIPLYCSKRGGPSEFHKLCDHKGPTVTIAKIRINNSELCLFGGYNNLGWKPYSNKKNPYYSFSKSNKNFLFLFENESDLSTTKIARVKRNNSAVGYCSDYGPIFGSKNYYYYFDSKPVLRKWLSKCKSKTNYPDFKNFSKLQSATCYTIEDYDVWQVVRKNT